MKIRLVVEATADGEMDLLIRAQEMKESFEVQLAELFLTYMVGVVSADSTSVPVSQQGPGTLMSDPVPNPYL